MAKDRRQTALAAGHHFSPEVMPAAGAQMGLGVFLFPFIKYDSQPDPRCSSGLSDAERNLILGATAAKLLGMKWVGLGIILEIANPDMPRRSVL
jgi:hypothetical protein